MISIAPEQMIESDVIANRLIHPGVSLSIHNLLELMLTESDNTATDVLVTAAGGPQAVTAWVQGQGVRGLRVDDATDGIVRRFYGLPREGAFPTVLEAALKANPALTGMTEHPNPAFDNDPRDTSTPRAMGELLTRIFNRKAMSAAGTDVLVGAMERCRTGAARLRGLLPAGTVVADKTGTIGGTVNDAGVITLPDSAGRIAIVVFIKKSDVLVAERERAIAEIGRSIRDYYLFQAH
jgi:beta-lactamase class A